VQSDPLQLLLDVKQAITQRSEIAKSEGTSIVLIVCSPATAEQDVVFDIDFNDSSVLPIVLTADEIREVTAPGVPIILVTPAIFSGGWLVNLSLHGSSPHGLIINDDVAACLLAQHCAGGFTSDLISAYTTSATPLLTEDERNSIKYPDHLMPINPSITQQLTHNAVQQEIQQALCHRFAGHGLTHEFVFEDGQHRWNKQTGNPDVTTFWPKH
jgi:hypothetical protein